MRGSIIILFCFTIGVLLGLYNLVPDMLIETDYSMYALYVLMFVVGVGVGSDKDSFKVIKTMNFKIVLVPISTIIGTYLGIGVFSFLQNKLNLIDCLAVGSGFGYYSLSSVLISELSGETLGVIALLSNISREIITLLFTPVFLKLFGKLAPVSLGGATSMDTTLPIITKYSGADYAIISVFHGVVLTIIIPFLITIIL
ncbi:MAG: lysine exporter LysO family protein [Bacteroidales bacterium]|nr:lysine exporter LysO family protein [Bacteroidales bacterium]